MSGAVREMSGTPGSDGSLKREVEEEPLVTFRDLVVSYGPVQALAGVSGAFYPGPTGLLGPNGAGKTTLLKTLLGFLEPDRGEMTAFGLDPTKAPLEVRRRIGYMPEVDCHLPGMTAAGFVAFAAELSGLPRDEAISRAHEVLYYVGLGEARWPRPSSTIPTSCCSTSPRTASIPRAARRCWPSSTTSRPGAR
jgi:ABC-type multidrug transport system ATPase subunit